MISDLVAKVEDVLASKGYSDQTRSDMQTVIEVRLGILTKLNIGKVFQCRRSVSIEHLMQVPSLIELDRFADEHKCLAALFVLNAICEFLKSVPNPTNGLRYIIVIEEAHNLIGSSQSTPTVEDAADPKSYTASLLSRMLVELRALGVGIILSDQHPSALDSGASKSVASKLAFRQVYSNDREELGRSMLFGDIEMQDISRLQPGEAFFFTEGYFGPRKIRTINLHEELNLSEVLTDKQLHEIICQEQWFQDAAKQRILVELVQYNELMDKYDDDRLEISSCVEKYLSIFERWILNKRQAYGNEDVCTVLSMLRYQRKKLLDRYEQLKRNGYKRFSSLCEMIDSNDKPAQAIITRFDRSIAPSTQKLLDCIDRTIKNIIKLKRTGA